MKRYDIGEADKVTITNHLFSGFFLFNIGAVEFGPGWGWVPLLGFAFDMIDIMRRIPDSKTERYEFTESNDQIFFKHVGYDIEVHTTYSDARVTIPSSELRNAVNEFAKVMIADFGKQWPQLLENEIVKEYLKKIESYWGHARVKSLDELIKILKSALALKDNKGEIVLEFIDLMMGDKHESLTDPVLEVLCDLAIDLDYYEPKPMLRIGAPFLYDDVRLIIEIRTAFDKLRSLGVKIDTPTDKETGKG